MIADRRYVARWPHGGKAQRCIDCGGDIVQVRSGRTMRCDGCHGTAVRRGHRKFRDSHPGYYTAEARRVRKERKATGATV